MSARERIARLAGLILRRRDLIERDADDELASVLEGRIARGIAKGQSPAEARAEALRQLGVPMDDAKAQLRQSAMRRERGLARHEWLSDIGADVRYALRGFRREPLFFAFAALTLALGVGANAAMFGIVDRLLLRGPAYVHDPHRVVRLYWTMRQHNGGEATTAAFDPQLYANLVAESHDFVGLAKYSSARKGPRIGEGDAVRAITAASATSNFLSVVGAPLELGRFFTIDEENNSLPVVVLGYDLWQTDFGRDGDIVGKQITLSDRKYAVVGVTRRGFTGANLDRVDVWFPFNAPTDTKARHWRSGSHSSGAWVVARLKDDVTYEDAGRDATRAHRATYDSDERAYADGTVSVGPLRYGATGVEMRETSIAAWIAGVSIVVLLIACANIASLLLARASKRRREIAVRLALGGTRWRLVRMLLVSSLLLAVFGGVGALVVAGVLSGLVRHALLPDIDWANGAIDSRVLTFSVAIVLATGLSIGILPAWRAMRADASTVLKAGSHDDSRSRSAFGGLLMVSQSAFAMVLLIGAGLFVRSLDRVRALDLGVQPDRVVVLEPRWAAQPTADDTVEDARRATALRVGIERLATLPDIEHIAAAGSTPFGPMVGYGITVPGWDSLPHLPGDPFPYPTLNGVTPDYFATLGTRVLAGRSFTNSDQRASEPVVIVGAAMANALWPHQSALDKCIHLAARAPACARVVGVVQDARLSRVDELPSMQYFLPLAQGRGATIYPAILVRPRADAALAIPALRAAVRQIDPAIRSVDAQLLQDRVDPQLRTWRVGATMFSLFAGLAVVVAAVGMFGVVAYLVEQRRYEIGVRIALGARGKDVVALMARGVIATTVAGAAIGVAIAIGVGGYVAPLLFDTSAHDPLTIGAVAALLLGVASVAGGIPALRARRVDPIVALKSE